MARITRPLTNNEILKAKPREKRLYPSLWGRPVLTRQNIW